MQAIEFQTILHNGIVTIPSEYAAQWEGKPIRVIVLDSAAKSSQPLPQNAQFQAVSLSTQGFKFNRDEANDR
jgi:hypothetical protein